MAHKYNDSHWQDNAGIFKPAYYTHNGYVVDIFTDTQKIIQKNCAAKHPEVFIQHYLNFYSSPANPASWMCIELLTIGELSRLYTALASNTDKSGIASYFGLHHSVFTAWVHTLTYVRNICAHHARLWNRDFAIKPDLLLKPRFPWLTTSFQNNNHRCFYFLCTLKYMLQAANPSSHFTDKLKALFLKYPLVPIQFLGIPTNGKGKLIDWENEPSWRS